MRNDEHAGPTPAEAARYARANRLWMDARTIADRYRADREGCRNRAEREIVWRTYCRAMLDEQADRIAAGSVYFATREKQFGFVRWRKSKAKDADLPVRFKPAWRAMTDEELLDLEEALIRARYRGADQDRVTPAN